MKKKKEVPFMPPENKIIPPRKGWEQDTLYLVRVSWCKSNPLHLAYLHVGFLHEDGSFASYCNVWCNNYGNEEPARKAYYLQALKKLHTMPEGE